MVTFCKYHALGNDYLVIDPRKTDLPMTPEVVRAICDRHCGVGSDGILYGPAYSEGVPLVRIYNPDGSEAEKSGNGVRIFARYLVDEGYERSGSFVLRTAGGPVAIEVLDSQASSIRVDMGRITFDSELIPVRGPKREVVDEPLTIDEETYKVTCASIGNPHCVIPVDEVSKDMVMRLGPLVENHEAFPNRINLQIMKVVDNANIEIEIWERGAGYTLASGSSSCAAACVGHRLGLTGPQVTVHMPGGTILVDIAADGHVFMTGSVTPIMRGVLLRSMEEMLRRVSLASS
jgi:diaminopimelate epimerase